MNWLDGQQSVYDTVNTAVAVTTAVTPGSNLWLPRKYQLWPTYINIEMN